MRCSLARSDSKTMSMQMKVPERPTPAEQCTTGGPLAACCKDRRRYSCPRACNGQIMNGR